MIRAVAIIGLFAAACGGAPAPVAATQADDAEVGCCLEDRWEEPPPFIGETPPDAEAPADALEPFQPE
jgi:hypothetical protein